MPRTGWTEASYNIRQRFISDMVDEGLVSVRYVPTVQMLADLLTKALPRGLYTTHWSSLPLVDLPDSDVCEHRSEILALALHLSASIRK